MSTPGEGEEGKLEEDLLQDVGRLSQRSTKSVRISTAK